MTRSGEQVLVSFWLYLTDGSMPPSLSDIDASLRDFRELVAEAQESHVDLRQTGHRFLDIIHRGDPAAENEATQLDNYFLETEQFRLALSGNLNIILGRKGSGKTAIFIQTRNRVTHPARPISPTVVSSVPTFGRS